MEANFGSKVAFALVDKLILGGALVIIGLLFQSAWHEEQLRIGNAELAGKLIPEIVRSSTSADDRSYLLKTLLLADAVEPDLAAVLTRSLIRDGVSSRSLAEAIGHSIRKDVGPFLDEAGADMREVAPEDGRSDVISIWRQVFKHHLDDRSALAATRIILSDEVLGKSRRFSTLAHMIGSGRDQVALRQTQANVPAVERVGQMAMLALRSDGYYEKAYKFVSERISRTVTGEGDRTLLWDEMEVLSKSDEIFGARLSGDIAGALGSVFVKDEQLRPGAATVLSSMSDCGAVAAPTLATFTLRLAKELASLEDMVERKRMVDDYSLTIYLLAQLASRMESEAFSRALRTLREIEEIKRQGHADLFSSTNCEQFWKRHGEMGPVPRPY